MKWLREHFADTKNSVCAQVLGVSESTLHRLARANSLVKTKEFVMQMQHEASIASAEANRGIPAHPNSRAALIQYGSAYRFKCGHVPPARTPEVADRIARNRNRTIAAERRRMEYGLPPRTRLNLKLDDEKDKRWIATRHRLKKLGYIIPYRGSMVVYFGVATNRNAACENYARVIGLKVMRNPEEVI